jgi:hypothetical protein
VQRIAAGYAVVPEDVRRFVLTNIPSVSYLEAALLFHRAPQVECTRVDVARALYLPEQSSAQLLEALCEAGILELHSGAEVRYRYAPRDAALGAAIERLAEVYASDMIGVTRLIHDSTQKSAHRFAEAFKLKKDR